MTTAQPQTKKEKRNAVLANIKKDWYVYAALLFALFALLHTINERAEANERIRADYEAYIIECQEKIGGTTEWNTNIEAYYTESLEDSHLWQQHNSLNSSP